MTVGLIEANHSIPTTSLALCILIFQAASEAVLLLPSSLMQHTIIVRTPCRAMAAAASNQPAQQCNQITRRGFYCTSHANELLGLEAKTSLLLGEPGEAGLGLFTTRNREA